MDKRFFRGLLFIVALIGLEASHTAAASDGDQVTAAYKNVTVRIAAANSCGGFGFIVGEEGGSLYIVTAEHVATENADRPARPQVYFFNDKTTAKDARIQTALLWGALVFLWGFAWKLRALK